MVRRLRKRGGTEKGKQAEEAAFGEVVIRGETFN
jgi:hypothetical protein